VPGVAIGVAVDVAVLSLEGDRLSVLLVKLKRAPFEGRWGLPGGHIGASETVEAAAARELREKTKVTDVVLEQVRCFSAPDRDPNGRCISVGFLALVPVEAARLTATGKYAGVGFFPADELPPLGYDHAEIAGAAVARLRALAEYTNVAWSLLPREFTLGALQRAHEAILGRALDARNFRKRVLESDMVAATGATQRGEAHRPARLYRFRHRKTVMIGRGMG
jgi:8-oxo-dGTP diphosphatase